MAKNALNSDVTVSFPLTPVTLKGDVIDVNKSYVEFRYKRRASKNYAITKVYFDDRFISLKGVKGGPGELSFLTNAPFLVIKGITDTDEHGFVRVSYNDKRDGSAQVAIINAKYVNVVTSKDEHVDAPAGVVKKARKAKVAGDGKKSVRSKKAA